MLQETSSPYLVQDRASTHFPICIACSFHIKLLQNHDVNQHHSRISCTSHILSTLSPSFIPYHSHCHFYLITYHLSTPIIFLALTIQKFHVASIRASFLEATRSWILCTTGTYQLRHQVSLKTFLSHFYQQISTKLCR